MVRPLLFVAGLAVAVTGMAESLSYPVTTRSGGAEVSSRLFSNARGPSSLELHLKIPQVDISVADDGFQRVEARGLNTLSQPGLPNVPMTGSLIAIPEGYEAVLEKVQERESVVDAVIVEPAQRKFRCGGSREEGFEFNREVYDGQATFPASNLKLETVGNLNGLKLARVAFYPIRFRPQTRQIVVNSEVLVRVHFQQVGRAADLEMPAAMYQLAKNATVNGNGLPMVRAQRGPETLWIVTADSLASSITDLVTWKKARGMAVEVFTVTEAGGTKEEIKKFLKSKYTQRSAKPTYLLFVGNKDTAPTFKESTGSGSAASDWSYSLLGSDEKIPSVFYGRLVADNEAEVTNQVKHWVQYERNPSQGSWYTQATTIASNEGSNPSDKEYAGQVADALKAGTYTKVDGFYQAEKTATAANIKGALNEGRSWLSYFGHGSGTSWGSTNDSFNVSTVDSLENGDKRPIIIDVACQNASWVNLSRCIGKAWVNHQTSGAVAYYGGSVNISWHEPAVMSVGVAKNHFEKKIPSLGGSVLAGQLYLFEKMGTGANTLDNLKWYNLLGDPSLVIRTSAPESYTLRHEVRAISGGYEVEVVVEGKRTKGVSVALSNLETGLISVGSTNEQGNAVLSFVGNLPSGTMLTATGYNMETQQVQIQ